MSLAIDEKYILLLSDRLKQFKKVDSNYNCRCPICGDSKRDKLKARGYFLKGDNNYGFFCQNCNASLPFSNFLKIQDDGLYRDYIFENFKHKKDFSWDSPPVVKKQFKEPQVKKTNINRLKSLLSISELPDGHKAKEYIRNRKIPQRYWKILFYTENYMKWVNEYVLPNKWQSDKLPKSDPRIVIPFYTSSGEPFAYQGRTLSKDENVLRYITIHQEENNALIYGLERIDFSKPILVCEGPLDSLFLDNCLAVAGSALNKLLEYPKGDFTFIFDNQNRSVEIVELLKRIIDMGRKVVIFPKHIEQKDINDMIVKGNMSIDEVMEVIKDNTYSGLKAKLKFNEWKEI